MGNRQDFKGELISTGHRNGLKMKRKPLNGGSIDRSREDWKVYQQEI